MISLSRNSIIIILATIAICTVSLAFIDTRFVRFFAFLILGLFLPGYLLVLVLYSRSDTDKSYWKLALILPASISINSIVLIILNYVWNYKYVIALIIMALINIILLLICAIIQRPLVRHIQFIPAGMLTNFISEYRRNIWVKTLLFSGILLLFSITSAYLTPIHRLAYSEFYLLTNDRNIPSSISRQALSNSGILVGIFNHENTDLNYRVSIYSQKDDSDILIWTDELLVNRDNKIEKVILLESVPTDINSLEIDLYKDEGLIPYRSLNIPIR